MNYQKTMFTFFALMSIVTHTSFATGLTLDASGTTMGSGEVAVTTQSVPSVNPISVTGIDFVDNKTLSLKLSESLSGISTDSEVKILEDLAVVNATKDTTSTKKVTVQLNNDLVEGATYSLVSVTDGIDSSIDFDLVGDRTKILNKDFDPQSTSIEYISVKDNKNIEVYFNKDLPAVTFEFKIFKELKVETKFLDTTNLNVKTFDELKSKNDYIAVLSLKDLTNKDIEIENSLYDFSTPEFAAPAATETPQPMIDTGATTLAPLTGSEMTGATTASGENVEALAMTAQKTPDTGTQTNVLLLLTFILSLSIFFARKKSLKM